MSNHTAQGDVHPQHLLNTKGFQSQPQTRKQRLLWAQQSAPSQPLAFYPSCGIGRELGNVAFHGAQGSHLHRAVCFQSLSFPLLSLKPGAILLKNKPLISLIKNCFESRTSTKLF